MAGEIDALLNERQSTHGSFANNACLSQQIKRVFHAAPGWTLMSDVQKESLDLIALKLSRVLSGRANHAEHWHDISGYASLVVKDLE